jgi:hypothetical protein
MENREDFRKELGGLIERLQEKQQYMSSELDSISKLIVMLCQINIFLDGDAASAAERIFEKKIDGSYSLNLLDGIRNIFIEKGYNAALNECVNRFNRVKEQLIVDLEPTNIAKFQEIKSFFGLKNDDATLNLLVNMAHAELGSIKSKFIRAKKKGEKPIDISRNCNINYNRVKKLSEQYKDV